jgi:hypothetical protein
VLTLRVVTSTAIERQQSFLKDLGVDRRAPPHDLGKEEASEWIGGRQGGQASARRPG